MYEKEVTIVRDGVRLAGTLCRPAESTGVVIFVHGSGPMDRDENAGKQKLNVFNRLAEEVGASGWASLRYDKRGVGASGGAYLTHGYDDLLGDIVACIGFLRDQGFERVVLCGHSEGTILATKAT